jgi:hypothetical protein
MKKYTLLFFCFLSLVAFSQKKKVTSKKTPAVIQKVEIPVQPKVEPCVERTFVAFEKQADNLVKLKVCDGNYQIKFVSDRIVETVFEPLGDASKSASHIVENKAGVTFRVEELDNIIWLKTFSLWVKIQKKPFNISYHKREDYLFSEGKGYHKPDSLHQINLKISSDEVLYGGGARVLGMNRRGNKLPLFNKAKYGYETKAEQMNFCLPIFLSSKIYMVHFDNPTTGFLDLDSQNKNEVNW